jgi:hypothetical protein
MNFRAFRRIAIATAVASFAGSGVAEAACPPADPVSQAFAQWGDSAYYTHVPGGGFEAGMAAWTLNANTIVSGNEKYYVNSTADLSSLRVKALGVAVSPSFCVDAAYPTLRLFGKKLTTTNGTLKVEILYKNSSGSSKVAQAGTLSHSSSNSYSDWKPSNILKLGTALPIPTGGTLNVQLRTTADRNGDWLVDDIYADPKRH